MAAGSASRAPPWPHWMGSQADERARAGFEPAARRTFPKIKIHFGPELWSVPLGYIVREDNDQARLALNSAIQAYFSTNSYAFLSSKHFGKDVRCKG